MRILTNGSINHGLLVTLLRIAIGQAGQYSDYRFYPGR
jgi:hypothetical protein